MKLLLLLLSSLLVPAFAWAGSRASASYAVPADTVDAGGRRTSSVAYRNDGSLGGLGGVGAVATITAKHSYVGQLYDPTNLVVAASPNPVNETLTSQLGASVVMDDGTRLTPAPSSVAWSVVSGPVSAINPAGLATTAAVYQNTTATLRGGYFGLTGTTDVLVVNTLLDNFGSYAGDGLDDAWQVLYFGLDNPLACPLCDPDLDLQNNRFEYIAGTIPTDFNSRFRLRIAAVPGIRTNQNLVFSPRFPSRTYTAEFRVNADSGAFAPLPLFSTSDAGIERTLTDLGATNATRFYRIGITYP